MHEDSKVGLVLKGTYRVERMIGWGAMGAVYEASHQRIARRFAIKVLSPAVADQPQFVARFEREAYVTSQLGHPHIVEVVDFDHSDQGEPYIVMEYLDGEDLGARMERKQRLTLEETLSIVRQATSAVQKAHENGIVHRDLKPPNVFLCKRGERSDYVKIVDFGISKIVGTSGSLTNAGAVIGTPYFMAPEQICLDNPVDRHADIWAVAALTFAMLAGRPPFAFDTLPELLYSIVHSVPPPLSEVRPDLPPGISAAIARALARQPADRFSSMDQFWSALSRACGQGPPTAQFTEDQALVLDTPPSASDPDSVVTSVEFFADDKTIRDEPRLNVAETAEITATAQAPRPEAAAPVPSGPASAAPGSDSPDRRPSEAPRAAEVALVTPRAPMDADASAPQASGRKVPWLLALGLIAAVGVPLAIWSLAGNRTAPNGATPALPARDGHSAAGSAPADPALEPSTKTVRIRANIHGANCDVTIRGKRAKPQRAPCEYSVPPGHRITYTVAKAGYRPLSRSMLVSGNLEVSATLQRQPRGNTPAAPQSPTTRTTAAGAAPTRRTEQPAQPQTRTPDQPTKPVAKPVTKPAAKPVTKLTTKPAKPLTKPDGRPTERHPSPPAAQPERRAKLGDGVADDF